ncbi:MAG: hypothetical protein ACPG4T_02110 [Nannocystaceae bacterium]
MSEKTTFLNVDLDLRAPFPLAEFVAHWGDDVFLLHHGPALEGWSAHFEVADEYAEDAETTIRAFVKLIRELPPELKKRWETLSDRVFDIGIQAGATPNAWQAQLSHETLTEVAAIQARLGITIYAPEQVEATKQPEDPDDEAENGAVESC